MAARSPSLRKINLHAASAEAMPSAATVSTTSSTSGTARPENPTTSLSPSRLPVKLTRRSSRPTSPSRNQARSRPTRVSVPAAPKPIGTGRPRSVSQRNLLPADNDLAKKDRSKPPITTSRHVLTASTSASTSRQSSHGRALSTSTCVTSVTSRPSTRGSNDSFKPYQALGSDVFLKKPAFNTHQQHFSPAKNLAPKPHPAVFLAPPTPSKRPANKAISAETAKLQNELLQLHLLHQDVEHVIQEWRTSAKETLKGQFDAVVKKKATNEQLETQAVARVNAAALDRWQNMGTPGWSVDDKIQVLDELLTGIWNLGEVGGKYSKVVRRFERWVKQCQETLQSRSQGDGKIDEQNLFIEKLESLWKDDCLLLHHKLENWTEKMRDLGLPDSGSSIGLVMVRVQRILKGMITELNLMAQIEEDAMDMELAWIDSMNNDFTDDEEMPTACAIWRVP
ncbi:hypothetical protein BGT96224_1847 [Blumeria graminis f. sp. tritici 96224]|uniref:Bgt-1847 n=1 Tax=Blumeria graminis f. sp. tritici 96224 TaxID=1268274 RepID=A0A381LEU0_BLUGR|nr:hypothetical protein BGT96224_1847 [Blumeria graminis f. sp. tritici 96224]